jgi:hypothetical protein
MQGTIRSTLSHIDAPAAGSVYSQQDARRTTAIETDAIYTTLIEMSSQNIGKGVKSELLLADSWHTGADNSCQSAAANKCFASRGRELRSGGIAPFSAGTHQNVSPEQAT